MRRWIVLVAILLTACSARPPQAGVTPLPASATPSSVKPAAPTASSTATLLSCRIPVMLSTPAGQPAGAWITFPTGAVESDPTSLIDRTGSYQGISYDRAFNRWIPADWNHISPDGRRYIRDGVSGAQEIVDVATGAKRSIAMPSARGIWTVVDYTPSGIYLTQMAGEGPVDPGLWLLNPDSGQLRQLDGTQFWSQVDAKSAWGVAPSPATGATLLSRLDFHTGTLSTELAVPYHTPLQPGDRLLELISLDAQGRPLVLLRDWQKPYPWRLAILTAPATLQDVHIPDEWAAGWPMWDNGDPFQSGRDLHGLLLTKGIWMYGTNSFPGLALLTPDGVLTQVATAPNNIFAIGGGCH